ncbi:c-type cytochrome [Glaciecola sp. MH2013]|uniref:di-heme oxidoreductase family protein n=1 Tax=Glaciecola sp. MH2013 TaxID=2785524 RepID=UPI00189D072D|nr:di-heme oxidoredictase family protein [Glaciecola sp. MH2013]MBF7072200.1 c-type cytochrome [Glaciecola sp. MH2013]
MKYIHKAIFFITVFVLSACGGGGSTDQETTPPETPPVSPPISTPVLDHSGLEPLSASVPDNAEYLSGGDATLFVTNEDAFSTRPDPIKDDFQLDGFFTSGDHIFRTPHDNAGPLLNTNNCQGCHLNDGRGVLPLDTSSPLTSALVKIGDSLGNPDPVYGSQIQTFAIQSFDSSDFESGWPVYNASINGDQLKGEAFTEIHYELISGTYPDGTSYELRKPIYKIRDTSFGPFTEDIRFSVRVSPQVFGAGLLAAIPQENILALADENDSNNDGISGRASFVLDVSNVNQAPETVIGRFTYKAQTPNVLQQAAAAYRGDTGVTSSIFPDEVCTSNQVACEVAVEREGKVKPEHDISDNSLALVEFYNRVLGVPARRGFDSTNAIWETDIVLGREHFFNNGCVACHTPRHITEEAAGSVLGELTLTGLEENASPIEMLSNQVIFPYTDLLLHDMGGSCSVTRELADGSSCSSGQACFYVQRCDGLADGLIQGDASGSEWKTPPLWGLGLVQTVNARASFLHDGRARTIEEAVLWHGGEAMASKQAFMQMDEQQRQQLLSFLASL